MLEFNYTDCFHYVDLDTKEVIHTVTNNDYGLGDRYTRDIVPITVDGTMYYPVFAFKNGLVTYPDKSASGIVIKCENYFVMENDIFNTWIVFCVDSANKLSTVQYQNIEDYLDRMYITTSDFSIESEDDNLLSINITTGASGDGFASYGSTFSPTCNVEMVKSEDGDLEVYIALNSEFYVVGEVLGIKQCFGRFWINERPRIMNETFTFSGIGALDYKASNIELNVKETTEKNVELITEKYGESHIIKDWNYYWEFIERDFFDATGVPLVIPGWEELVDKMAEYHTYQLMIPYIQSSTTNETTAVEQYEFAKFNWREILSGVAVLLKRNVIEKNGSIYIEAISEEDVAINLRFNEDCYEDGSDFDNILVSPYPINVVSNRFYNNYTGSPYAYSNDTNSITTQLQIPNSIYGNLVNYSVNIECPWITWELADRIHYSGYAFPVYDAYIQKNALWGQFLNIAKRFSYNPAQISFVGYHPLLSAGNLVSVESYDGAGKLIYVAEMTLSYDGGVTISVNSKADIQTNATNSSSATSGQGSASSTSTATQSGMTNGIMYGTTIKDGVLDGAKIKDSTIDGSKIVDSTITGSKIDFSTFENGVIKGSSIDTSTFTDGQISGSVIDTSTFLDGTIKGSVIESSTLKDIPFASMDEAFIGNLMSDEIFADTLKAEVANIGALTVEDADIRYADIKLGNIDVANINKANIGSLFAEVGLIDRATIVDGHVTGFLDAVEVNANKITAGTLIADRLLLRGSEQSILYQLNSLTKNLIPYPYAETTHTQNDIVWTDNNDGTVTANNTASSFSQFYFNFDKSLGLMPNTTYTLSGCPSGGDISTYRIRIIINYQKEGQVQYSDVGNGVTFTTPSNYIDCRIMIDVNTGVTLNNATFKPMLTKGSEVIPFEPYREHAQALTSETLNGEVLTDNTITADKIVAHSITSNEIDVEDLFAQDITASGTITGANLIGTTAEINNGSVGGFNIENGNLVVYSTDANGFVHTPFSLVTSEGSAGIHIGNHIDSYPFLTIENDNILFASSSKQISQWSVDSDDNPEMLYQFKVGEYTRQTKINSSGVEIGGGLSVKNSGATSLSGSLTVSGGTTLSSTLAVSGTATLKNGLKLSSTTPSIYFHYGNASSYTSRLYESSSGVLRVSKDFDVFGNFDVGGVSSLDVLNVSGDTTLSNTSASTLSVSGSTNLTNLFVSGSTGVANLIVTGDLTVSGSIQSLALQWKRYGSVESASGINIASLNSSNCNEIYVMATNNNVYVFSTVIPYDILNSTERQFIEGYDTGSYNGVCAFHATNKYIKIGTYRAANVTYDPSLVTVTVYYR